VTKPIRQMALFPKNSQKKIPSGGKLVRVQYRVAKKLFFDTIGRDGVRWLQP
jgi:hypothetical protein